jgi:hypothetical protein
MKEGEREVCERERERGTSSKVKAIKEGSNMKRRNYV